MIGYSRGMYGSNRHNRACTGWLLLPGLLVMLASAGCGGGPSQSEADSRPLERAIGSEPESLDPHLAKTTQAQIVQRDLFEGLVIYSPDGRVVPGVAERWEVSNDGLEYTFYLREDARWSNGDPVSADDFVYSLRRLTDPATASFYAETLNVIKNTSTVVSGESPATELGIRASGTRLPSSGRRRTFCHS